MELLARGESGICRYDSSLPILPIWTGLANLLKLTHQDWGHVNEPLTLQAAGLHSTTLYIKYSRVCGRVRYQFGVTKALTQDHLEQSWTAIIMWMEWVWRIMAQVTIVCTFWTFASALSETYNCNFKLLLPLYNYCCTPVRLQHFDYFCESGLNSPWVRNQLRILYPNDHCGMHR